MCISRTRRRSECSAFVLSVCFASVLIVLFFKRNETFRIGFLIATTATGLLIHYDDVVEQRRKLKYLKPSGEPGRNNYFNKTSAPDASLVAAQ